MAPKSAASKGAELASVLGAAVLGAGVALMAPQDIRAHGLPLVLVGVFVHGVGMTLKYRLEGGARMAWWERALFYLCWFVLIALTGWMGITLMFVMPG